jgi:hypothetical protein
MAQPTTISHQGALTERPFCGSSNGSLLDVADTSFQGTYQASKTARIGVVGATDLLPFVLSLDGIVKVRAISVKAQAGATIKIVLTSAAGTDQAFSATAFLLHSPNSGSEFTAIKFVGTADLEILIAGDLS